MTATGWAGCGAGWLGAALVSICAWSGPGAGAPQVTSPCPDVEITSPEPLALTPMEVHLLCGDPTSRSWARIPESEAGFLLRSFLQSRGFLHAQIQRTASRLSVATGEPTVVRAVSAASAPPELDISRYRPIRGARLTPKLLSDLETWVRGQVRDNGYACPKITSHGDPDSGDVVVSVVSGPRQALAAVRTEPKATPLDRYLRRNDAFRIGDTYDDRLVILTQRRAMAKEVLVDTTLEAECEPTGVVLVQKSLPGPALRTSFGFGLNTEELFLVRGAVRYGHLGRASSAVEAVGVASRLQQQVSATGDWYPLATPSRFFVQPRLAVLRDAESKFEARSALARLAAASSYDGFGVGVTGSLGPQVEVVQTVRGPPAPAVARAAGFSAEVRVMSHDYEYDQASPRSGFQLGLDDTYSAKALGSTFEAQELRLSGETLWNVASLEPPMAVVGWRYGLGTTLTAERAEALAEVPPSHRQYLGGETRLRGFARESLPAGADGALSMAYSGVELRLTDVAPQNLQPLVFLDAGETGEHPARLGSALFWAPGAGVRWQSPLGPLRLSFAHGFVSGSAAERARVRERWNVYGSFGEEF